jgi:hypothetical protein
MFFFQKYDNVGLAFRINLPNKSPFRFLYPDNLSFGSLYPDNSLSGFLNLTMLENILIIKIITKSRQWVVLLHFFSLRGLLHPFV